MTEKYNFNELVVTQFPRLGRGWSGGGTVANGNFIEAGGKETVIAVRDLHTGQLIGEPIKTDIPTSIHDISYDPFTGTLWVSPGGGLQSYWNITMEGKKIRAIRRPEHGFGIFCDREDRDVMWGADQQGKRLVCVETATGDLFVRHVPLSFAPRGVAKVGSYFWTTLAGELNDPKGGHLYRVDSSGNILNDFPLPRSKYAHDAGGLTVDSEGYLWMVGGKKLPIYRLDIKKVTGESIPQPVIPPITPEEPEDPITPDPDNTIQGVLSRLADLEAWKKEMERKFNL